MAGRLDVADPQAIKLLRLALEQEMDLHSLELTGSIEDHIAARQFLEVLVDIPPQSMPKVSVEIVDRQFDPQEDFRHGRTDETWERMMTWSHLMEYGIRVQSSE